MWEPACAGHVYRETVLVYAGAIADPEGWDGWDISYGRYLQYKREMDAMDALAAAADEMPDLDPEPLDTCYRCASYSHTPTGVPLTNPGLQASAHVHLYDMFSSHIRPGEADVWPGPLCLWASALHILTWAVVSSHGLLPQVKSAS